MGATWTRLDVACRARSEAWVENEIEAGRLPFRGDTRGEGPVTSEGLKPDWTIEKIYGADRKLSLIWLDDAAMVEGVEVLLPADDASPAPSSPVRRWRKPPPVAGLKAASLAVAKTYRPDDPPTQADWWETLNRKLGEPVTRKVALDALAKWAPHLRRNRGQKPNRQT